MQARQIIVLAGDRTWAERQIRQRIIVAEATKALWVTQDEAQQADYTYLPHSKIQTVLGQEFDIVIYDAQDAFYPNAFGAVSGCIRAGGLLLLLLDDKPSHSLFINRLLAIINANTNKVKYFKQNSDKLPKLLYSVQSNQYHEIKTTEDQQLAIAAINKVVNGHRRRPLVITADRGRGKSAALGLAAKQLLSEKLSSIVVTAPSKKSAEMVFKHAENSTGLVFIPPDELSQTLVKTDLLLIDEAAAIPAPLLKKFLQHYSRIVFATTQHGYEGTGRGFNIRFRQALERQTPNWRELHLKTPIRWAENDPLEQFTFAALLLNADFAQHITIKLDQLVARRIDRQDLLANEALLSQIFGLLLNAHYQTKPSDLQYLLDDPAVSIYLIQSQNTVIATALTASEGGFSQALADEIYQGKRRVKGHLIPQSLAFHSGIATAASTQCERIIRIAVHPDFQRQGLATRLINQINRDSQQTDYLGVSFAASRDMLQFWEKQNFKPVRLGLSRDASSGTHSLIALLPKSSKGQKVFTQAQEKFRHTFAQQLAEPLKNLEDTIAIPLLQAASSHINQLDAWHQQAIQHFIHSHQRYEECIASLWHWLLYRINSKEFNALSSQQQALLINKIMQKKSWQEIVKKHRYAGKKAAVRVFREVMIQCMGITL